MVEHFRPLCVVSRPYRPLCFFRPLAQQNRPQGSDFAHFEKQWSSTYFTLCNILNMKRYTFSAPGQTCSCSDEATRDATDICLSENVSLLRHSYAILPYWHGITSVTDKPRWGNLLWKCVGYSRIFWHEKCTKKPQQTWKANKSRLKPNCI